MIENEGGKIVSAFSGKVNLVITNNVDGTSSTLVKARDNGIKIVDIKNFF
jgi:NAD-dependent DNA ligase